MALRGSHVDGETYDAFTALLGSAIRVLQAASEDAPTNAANENPSDEAYTNKVIWFVCAAAAFILCHVYCLVAMVKQRWNRPPQEEVMPADEDGSVHDMVFNLDPAQRRAVLEIIFSESSQVGVIRMSCLLLDWHCLVLVADLIIVFCTRNSFCAHSFSRLRSRINNSRITLSMIMITALRRM